ncbi:phosphate acyltransferase PlsX [Bengtsoniella intestinalis]
MKHIIVDAMGGDHAPQAPVQGALDALKAYDVEITLVGRLDAIQGELTACGVTTLPAHLHIQEATEVVEICDDPATAFKRKKDSSLTVGLNMVKSGAGDAFVSAGSTGALLSGATLLVKRIRGVRRAALCPQIPTKTGHTVLCDCGANAECTPEYLLQFAFLANLYAKNIMGLAQPKVGLLNIGAEPSKGDSLRLETYGLLQKAHDQGLLHFIGNVEGSDAMLGEADVIVADGFTGNVMLKTMEGTAKFMNMELKSIFLANLKSKLGALLVSKGFKAFKKKIDPNEVGALPSWG